MTRLRGNRKPAFICAFVSVLYLLCVSAVYPATVGKIAGRIFDEETGDPLPGANIIIEGTIQGAAADENGEYFILNVTPGWYVVRGQVIGYTIARIVGVRVQSDITTWVDIAMTPTVIEGEEVVVTSERPVVNLDIANTSTILGGDELVDLPVLQFKDALSRQMGAEVLDSRGLILRSGREHEISLTLDGMETRDGIDGMVYTRINPDAVQEVQISTGGFNAQYGNARAGIISIQTKEGGDKYAFTLDVRTSQPAIKHFGKPWYEREREIYLSDDALHNPVNTPERVVWANDQRDPVTFEYGIYDTLAPEVLFEGWEARSQEIAPEDPVYGGFHNRPELCRELYKWRLRNEVVKYGDKPDFNGNFTFGGPVPFLKNTRFFTSGRFERNYYLVRAQQDYFKDWGTSLKINSQLTPKLKLILTSNYMETSGVNRTDREYGVVGVGAEDPNKDDQRYIVETPEAFAWFMNLRLAFLNELWPYSEVSVSTRIRRQYGMRLSHMLSNKTYWDLSLNYQTFSISGRYDTQKRVLDKTKTFEDPADPGYSVTLSGPYAYAPQGYYRDEEGLWSFVEDITDVRVAGSYHNQENSRASSLHLRADITSQINKYNLVNFGGEFTYLDVLKDEYRNYDINDRHWWEWHVYTKHGAFYLQNKLEFKGMIASVGLRAEYSLPHHTWYDLDNNPYQPWFSTTWVTLGEGTDNRHYDMDRADSAGVKPVLAAPKKRMVLSPRLAVSHPIGTKAKIFFNYGHYNQLPDLEKRYYFMVREGAPPGRTPIVDRVGNPNLDFERTVQYEVGYAQSLFDVFNVQITGYYRDITNLARQYSVTGYFDTVHVTQPIDTVYTYSETGYNTWSNSGAEDIRGIEFRFEKRVGQFLTGWVNGSYDVYSDSRYGYSTIDEEPGEEPSLNEDILQQPSARPRWNTSISFRTPPNFGPRIFGTYLFGGFNLNLLYWWKSQPKISYNYRAGLNTNYQPFQNVQWKAHHAANLRFSKRFRLGRVASVFYIQVLNAFNQKNMNRAAFSGSELTDYLHSLKFHEGDQLGDYPHDGEKSYIKLPDPVPFFLFLNPRQIFAGFRIEL